MIVVTPYRPMAPESGAHQKLGAFDWLGAVHMLRVSVAESCRTRTVLLTEAGADVADADVHAFETGETRLMLWILAVALAYLRSDAFVDDTAWISPDSLVYSDLRGCFRADLGVIVRCGEKYKQKPLLNSVQFWRVAAKNRLIAFYEAALARARTLPESVIRWGADTAPLTDLLAPLQAGGFRRGALTVFGFEAGCVFRTLPMTDVARLERRASIAWPVTPIVDFKYGRKLLMRRYFEATWGRKLATVCA